jgi:hypothetical protein
MRFEQPFLAIHSILDGSRGLPAIAAVGLHFARFHIVGKICLQHFVAQKANQPSVLDREKHFNAADKVTRHQVGAAQIDLLFSSVVEVVDPAVLQEAPHDAGNPDCFAHARNSRPQAADAAHQQIHFYASLRRFIKKTNHFRIFERVHLENQV